MSRIEAGSLRPEKVWYPLEALLRDVLDRMHPFLEGRTVQTSLPDALPPVEVDVVLIEQVLTNLITNAVSYTPAGSPIEVSVQAEEEAVIVSIADRGPGIALAEQEHIFDKFYRVLGKARRPAETRETRGSGLGLALCRGLVEAHGGRIWTEPTMAIGPLQIDFAQQLVTVNGQEVKLTRTEYDLLKVFVVNRGKIMTQQMLLTQVWGTSQDAKAHYLHVYIGQLRRKIEPDPAHPRFLTTISGVGYRFNDE